MLNSQIFLLNGNKYRIDTQTTLYNLISYMGYKQNLIAVEYNDKIIVRKMWKNTQIKNRDRIEIITIVGGG